MKPYIEIIFDEGSVTNEILLAELAEAGFEGFEESGTRLKAFMPQEVFDEQELKNLSKKHQLGFEKNLIQPSNWNADWESGFKPVTVDNFVCVRADFHETVKGVDHEIIITPKMSFGTGHHATTYLMIQEMGKIEFKNKRVMDFGTGTGILAILAEKLGAESIHAIDNDDWSIENAKENTYNNSCNKIALVQADNAGSEVTFDIILANINKNVILDNLELLSRQLAPGGIAILSGLLVEDEGDITAAAQGFQFKPLQKNIRDNWLCLRFEH